VEKKIKMESQKPHKHRLRDSERLSSIKGRKAGIGELSWLFSRGV